MIAIGIHTGGPELSNIPLVAVLKKAMTVAKRHRDPSYDSGQEGWVNPVFVLPGSVYKPDFEGFKIGHFSRKEKGVVVTIAVPPSKFDAVSSVDYITQALRESIELASKVFAEKKINFSKERAEGLILEIAATLRSN
ncbi:hypothetical protein FHT70_002268 [Rhizobium sp. BK049]|uniref:hypothetical protein n=1 Tax=Rhizobium sp. BK049 TaxID=2587095 RepID=UPI00160F2F98|nr:hypothetical protein [Rhizobium sp. BK049]MBB3352346.1 hypothetical protein [Rhizobium sp. BK049]